MDMVKKNKGSTAAMANYLLFKQVVCLILFFETLVLWPKFYRYFGPPSFPNSFITTTARVFFFNLFLLTNLALLFFNIYPLVASLLVALCMRYQYVTNSRKRLVTAGAVGHICLFASAYIFIFEVGYFLDQSNQLSHFFHHVFAIEVGIIMTVAGAYKYLLGYCDGSGFEYALVNPSWSKFFFLFKGLSPSSLFYKINNYAACIMELLSGVLLLIPQTRQWGAILLLLVFIYVILTVRVSILPLLMMSTSILYIPPLAFHFPTFDYPALQIQAPALIITMIEIAFVLYLAVYIFTVIYRALRTFRRTPFPEPIKKFMEIFIKYRPFFEWGVFTSGLTNFFVKIDKISKSSNQVISSPYDGFSKNYREAFETPGLFFRYIHHHESSCLLNIFFPTPKDTKEQLEWFQTKLVKYAQSLLSESEIEDTLIQYTIILIEKTPTEFLYTPYYSYTVDAREGKIVDSIIHKKQ